MISPPIGVAESPILGDVDHLLLMFADLGTDACRYPIGDRPSDRGYHFCGAPRHRNAHGELVRMPYCPIHYNLCVQAPWRIKIAEAA